MDPYPQYLPPGSDAQAAPIGMIEEPASTRGTYDRSDNPGSSNLEGDIQLGKSNHVNQSNSTQNPTEINLDASALSSPSR